MPSYCSAVNCKNNGFTNPELSFFKFPENRKDITEKWIQAMRRINWEPTKYSRLCSIHFEDNCFFLKKGTRLRLLPDAVPSIFDFRKLKSNRKKAEGYLNMNENDCPDPELYEIETAPVLVKSAKSGQKCRICSGPADCDMTMESAVITKKGTVTLSHIISTMINKDIDVIGYICMSCSQRLVNSYMLKCDIEENKIFSLTNSTNADYKKKESNSANTTNDTTAIKAKTKTDTLESLQSSVDENIIYCFNCDVNFLRLDIAKHLITCKMREEADQQNIPIESRRLFVCYLCQFLVYRHNAIDHMEICNKINRSFS